MLLQVSNVSYTVNMYSTDIDDLGKRHVSIIYALFDRLVEGSKHKNRDFA